MDVGKHLGSFYKATDSAPCNPATSAGTQGNRVHRSMKTHGQHASPTLEGTPTSPLPSSAMLHSTPAAVGPTWASVGSSFYLVSVLSDPPPTHTEEQETGRARGGCPFDICGHLSPEASGLRAASCSMSAFYFVSAAFLLVRRASSLPGGELLKSSGAPPPHQPTPTPVWEAGHTAVPASCLAS